MRACQDLLCPCPCPCPTALSGMASGTYLWLGVALHQALQHQCVTLADGVDPVVDVVLLDQAGLPRVDDLSIGGGWGDEKQKHSVKFKVRLIASSTSIADTLVPLN